MTHPFHPLNGRAFTLLDRRNTWGEDRVYFHDDVGRLRRMPAAWTNAVVTDVFASVSGGRAHFRIPELLELVALIARQSEARGATDGVDGAPGVSSK